MNNPINILLWAARIVAAIIMLQTLYFKFRGEPESIYIFTAVGIEPWGRYGTGLAELIASILILMPRTSWIGAGLALGIMSGAILTHLTILGIEVQGDGGYLFFLAVAVAACSSLILYLTRSQWIPVLMNFLPGQRKTTIW